MPLLILLVVAFIEPFFIELMFNYLFTSSILLTVFGTPTIGYWQALTLSVVTNILFKSHTKSE